MNVTAAFQTLRPAGAGQVVSYTGTAGTIATALPQGARSVWVFCTTIAHVKIGASPTATTADIPVPASFPIRLVIENNTGDIKVSAIQSAAGGNLHVQPLAD